MTNKRDQIIFDMMDDLPDPNIVGSSEYWAIYTCIVDGLESNPDIDPREHAIMIAREFVEHSQMIIKRWGEKA